MIQDAVYLVLVMDLHQAKTVTGKLYLDALKWVLNVTWAPPLHTPASLNRLYIKMLPLTLPLQLFLILCESEKRHLPYTVGSRPSVCKVPPTIYPVSL